MDGHFLVKHIRIILVKQSSQVSKTELAIKFIVSNFEQSEEWTCFHCKINKIKVELLRFSFFMLKKLTEWLQRRKPSLLQNQSETLALLLLVDPPICPTLIQPFLRFK